MVRAGSGFLDTGLIFHYNDGSKPGDGSRQSDGNRQETKSNTGGDLWEFWEHL